MNSPSPHSPGPEDPSPAAAGPQNPAPQDPADQLTRFADRSGAPLPTVAELGEPAPGFAAWMELLDVSARRTARSWARGPGSADVLGTLTWLNGRANGALDTALTEARAAEGTAAAAPPAAALTLALGVSLGVRTALEAVGDAAYRNGRRP